MRGRAERPARDKPGVATYSVPADTKVDLPPGTLFPFEHTLAVMQTAEHIERVAFECTVDLAADGVVYAEVRFAPELHQTQGLSLDEVVTAVTDGVASPWPDLHDACLKIWKNKFARLRTAGEIAAELSP